MAVAELKSYKTHAGNGTRGPFAFTDGASDIPAKALTDIAAFRIDDEGVIEDLANGVDFTASGTFDAATGVYTAIEVTLAMSQAVLAAASGPLAAHRLVIFRSAAIESTADLQYNERFPSRTFTFLLDRISMIEQQLRDQIGAAVRLPLNDQSDPLPDRLARKGMVIGFDADSGDLTPITVDSAGTDARAIDEVEFTGTGAQVAFVISNQTINDPNMVLVWVGGSVQPTTAYGVSTNGVNSTITFVAPPSNGANIIVRLLGYRSPAAAASEDNAAASAVAAAASASAAATSASAASTSATAAASSASAASTSAGNASASATAAAASASAASTSATNAAASATAAATSASAASTSATNAAASATAAATSASAASTSATAAAASATSAASSALDAASLAYAGGVFTWDTGTSDADPGTGKLRANNATLASATMLYINETDALGSAMAALFGTWDDSTSPHRAALILRKRGAPATYAAYYVTAANTDAGAYQKITVSYIAGAGSFSAADSIGIAVQLIGDKGDTGPGSGDLLAANNLNDVASKPTARSNLGLNALALLNTVGTSQIDNDAVTYAKMQNVSATSRLLGRITTGAGDVEELTAANVKTILALSTGDISGLGTAALVADNTLVHLSGTETITGAKTFSAAPLLSGQGVRLSLTGVTGSNYQAISFEDSSAASRFQIGRDNANGYLIFNRHNSSGTYVDTPFAIPINGSGDPVVRGNTVLHTGNVGTYALPISGGSITGDLRINKSYPQLVLYATDGSALAKAWGEYVNSSTGALTFIIMDDSPGGIANWLVVARSGTTPTAATFGCDVVLPDVSTTNNMAAGTKDVVHHTITADTTLALSDRGKCIYHNSGSTHTLTIPPNSDVAFPIGTIIMVQVPAGTLNIARGSGVSLYNAAVSDANRVVGTYQTAFLKKDQTNTWKITGEYS